MIIGVPTFAVIYMLVRETAGWLLHRKGMAVATDAYASENEPIIHKEEKKKKAKKPPGTAKS